MRSLHSFKRNIQPPDITPCLTDVGEVGIGAVERSQLAALTNAADSLLPTHVIIHANVRSWVWPRVNLVNGRVRPHLTSYRFELSYAHGETLVACFRSRGL